MKKLLFVVLATSMLGGCATQLGNRLAPAKPHHAVRHVVHRAKAPAPVPAAAAAPVAPAPKAEPSFASRFDSVLGRIRWVH